MILLLDVASKIRGDLINIAKKISDNLTNYKTQFGIGVTDANLLSESIAFTLEIIVRNVKLEKDDYEDVGLLIETTISFESLLERNYDRVIKIDIDLFRSNGIMIETRTFIVDPYVDESSTMNSFNESLIYLNEG